MPPANNIIKRCVNIDWLEIYCIEPADTACDAEYFENAGYEVVIRAYGTPQYREMFTILKNGFPYIEVRRNPYSLKSNGGIFENGACHIRLANETCYKISPVDLLRQFVKENGYTFKNVTRLDICLDVINFDDGLNPADFINDYLAGKYFKNHLSNIQAYGEEYVGGIFTFHGKESTFGRTINSIKWGSPSSRITIKLYDKTKEMIESKDKPYIRNNWVSAELINDEDLRIMSEIRDRKYKIGRLERQIKSNCNNKMHKKETIKTLKLELKTLESKVKKVWRIEVSLNSELKGIVNADNLDKDEKGRQRIYSINLNNIDTRDKLLFMFHVFTMKYFEFKISSVTRDGKPQRKDRCKSYFPINSSTLEMSYKPKAQERGNDKTKTDKIVINKLRDILTQDDWQYNISKSTKEALRQVLRYMSEVYQMDEVKRATEEVLTMITNDDKVENQNIQRLVELRQELEDIIEVVKFNNMNQ